MMSVVGYSPLLRFAKGRASRHQKVLLNQWSEFWGEAQTSVSIPTVPKEIACKPSEKQCSLPSFSKSELFGRKAWFFRDAGANKSASFGRCPLRNWPFDQKTALEARPHSGVPKSFLLEACLCLIRGVRSHALLIWDGSEDARRNK